MTSSSYDILVDYSAERGARYWGRLKKVRTHNSEAMYRRKDGRIMPVGVTNNFIEFDGKEYICSFVRDHAERRRAAVKLEENRQFLLEAQRVAHLGSWEWDIVENVVTWSDELYRIYGLNPEEFGASFEGFLERVHPDDRERVRGLVDGSYQNRTPLDFYHRIVRPDGTICTLHAHGEVTTDEANNPIRMVGTGLDVTELVKAEEEIRKLNAELEQRVSERTAELESTLRRLKESQNQLMLREKMASWEIWSPASPTK
jgi:PAS domain S-box-containing protein